MASEDLTTPTGTEQPLLPTETPTAEAPAAPARRRTRKAASPAAEAAAGQEQQTPVAAPKRTRKKAAATPPVEAESALPVAEAAPKKARRTAKATAPVGAEPVDETTEPAPAKAKATRKRASKAAAAAKTAPVEGTVAPADAVAVEAPVTESAAAPASAFGLLFQAPEPVTAPPRRRTSEPAPEPEPEPQPDAGTDESAQGEDDAEDGGRKRRRRGGRGRRSRGADETRSEDEGSEPDTEAAEGDQRGEAEDGEGEESTSSRRRRRRRRNGSGATDTDDPPGTVTRVREPRKDRDEPTAVKGSTRLEAKKQRRREGREAGRRRTIITEAEFLARRESVERVMVVGGREEHTQIGVLEDGVLVEHYVSRATTASMAGNVYLGRVQNVLPSMEAAFVDIGKGRNAVLYAGEVNWDAAGLEINQAKRIENALSSGDTVLVQVTKDPIGHKGARLTSQISLPGRYLVYVPEGSMTGISRKLPDTERARLKAILKEVLPDSAGVIVRTAAEGASEEELRADVERLTKTWEAISAKAASAAQRKSGSGGAPLLLHGEADLTVRVIRDVFTEDFTSLVVAGERAWREVSSYVHDVAPDLAPRLTRWTGEGDVFAHYRIDEQIAKAMDRKVWLPSGGSLVIDRTEAMTVIDVNTGKFVGSGGNLEETVTKNNIEAAEEIVRQLRLRDIGGIIVIDFIDMVLESNRELVVRRLLECLGRDRTKHQVAEVTSLGLVQMTRKRVGSGLIEVFSEPCECCSGRGIVIHSEPVDKTGSEATSSTSSRRSSRRSRPASETETNGRAPAAGPTAAQIAAAAHAAAVRRMHGEDDEAAEGSLEGTDAVQDVAPEVAGTEPAESTPARPEETVPEAASEVTEVPTDTEPADPVAETPAAADPAPAPAAPEPPTVAAPPARRRRGRVVAPAGPPRPTAAAPDDLGPESADR